LIVPTASTWPAFADINARAAIVEPRAGSAPQPRRLRAFLEERRLKGRPVTPLDVLRPGAMEEY
jgi:hypothetical protein